MTSNSNLPLFFASSRQGGASRDSAPSGWFNFNKTCSDGEPIQFGAEHPGLLTQAGYGSPGCAIDTDSDLTFGAPGTSRMKGPKQNFARPFATTPFLGGGSIDHTDDESRVIFGHSTANRKSIHTVTDKQFPNFTPLIPEKIADISESNYFVEPFLRGGLSSRLIPKVRVDLKK